MKRILWLPFFFSFSGVLQAADIPTIDIGAEQYNQDMCVERYANECINTICLTSEERDCQDQCRTDAVDKCEEQMEE
ncbi:hypothetical protein [Legionella nagasakiensis]|uniref:hypothetical protein n=1 Tax=Legionella nagasakiensis TaxID=535290 RepID=UPI0010564CEC|nr:hypothetical protein [Legionella nagasakiensis]